jgi:DNA-binding transcriptional LysR family regulator
VEIRQLHAFVAVGEELHFGRAAARLHMAQSPLSQLIRRLEADVGVPLLRRTTRRVELLPAGEVLLERAHTLLAAARAA